MPQPKDTGPTLDELLEFWSGKKAVTQTGEVWALEQVFLYERGDDVFCVTLFALKEAALWDLWTSEVSLVREFGGQDDWDHQSPTDWLAATLEMIQQLRDDGWFMEGEICYRLTRAKVYG